MDSCSRNAQGMWYNRLNYPSNHGLTTEDNYTHWLIWCTTFVLIRSSDIYTLPQLSITARLDVDIQGLELELAISEYSCLDGLEFGIGIHPQCQLVFTKSVLPHKLSPSVLGGIELILRHPVPERA